MRRLLILVAALFVSCGSMAPAIAQEASPVASPGSECAETTEQENEAIVMRWYDEVLNGQDLAVINEIIGEEADHSTSTFTDSGNREETRSIVSSLLTSYPDFQNTTDEIIAEGDLVVVRWTSSGTFQEELRGIVPTGETHTWTGINIFRIECGLIVESWSEVDRLAMLGQDDEPATPEA